MVDIRLSEDSVVLQLSSSNRRTVAGDQDQLGLATSKRLDGVSISDLEFSGLDDQLELGVNVNLGFLGGGVGLGLLLAHTQIVPIGNIDFPI